MPAAESTPKVYALYRDGCVQCSFLDTSASSCVVIVSKKSQINSSRGITSIEVFNFTRKEESQRTYGCINRNINNFNIIVFTFDKVLQKINGPGVRVVEDKTTTATTTTIIAGIYACVL